MVGMGVMGRHHARILSQLEHVDLVAVCDPDPAARRLAMDFGAEVHEKVEHIAAVTLDFVVVAVPTSRHREVTGQVLRPGLSVLVEKPLASTVTDGEAMIADAARAGARLGVGHVERFNPVVIAAGELVRSGRFGEPLIFGARRLGPLPPRITDVGVIVDLATHDIDVITHLHPSPVEIVQAQAHRRDRSAPEDSVTALMGFIDGVSAVIEANWITPTKVRELHVTGAEGMFVADYLSQELTLFSRAAEVADWPLAGMQQMVERRILDVGLVRAEPLLRELEEFTLAAREDRPMPVSGEQGLRVLRLAAALERAASSRDSVRVEDPVAHLLSESPASSRA